MKALLKTAAVAAVCATFGAAAQAQSIVDIAVGDERFSTLVAAVQAAGLAEPLAGPGPFETLLLPEIKGQLTYVLLFHVDDRRLAAADFPSGSNYFKPILESERLCITASGAGVSISDGTGDVANVVIADIQADNGVIHVIDKVLLPGTRPACH